MLVAEPSTSDQGTRERVGAYHSTTYAEKGTAVGRAEPNGIALLVDGWHAQGHATVRGVKQPPVQSLSQCKSVKAAAASTALKSELTSLEPFDTSQRDRSSCNAHRL